MWYKLHTLNKRRNKMYVYRFLNKNEEVIYVGQTKYLDLRIGSHNHLPKIAYKETEKNRIHHS